MQRTIVLKVGKEIHNLTVNEADTFQDIQAMIFAMTDIPPKNIKLLFKAKMLKDLPSLLSVPADAQVLVLGTKTTQELKPINVVEKVEKMEVQLVRYGLVNVGNTCYMNAAIQLLRSIAPFEDVLQMSVETDPANLVNRTLHSAIITLKKQDLSPKMFVGAFLQSHQQYLPLGRQHDSDEFLQDLLKNVCGNNVKVKSKLNNLLQIKMVEKLRNLQIEEQLAQTESYTWKLCCSMGGVDKDNKVGTLQEGIKLSLEGTLRKTSAVDGLMHTYSITNRFDLLPPYLLVQMARFFMKPAEDLPNSKPVATKICKTIDFGHRMDLFDFCSENLKTALKPGRLELEKTREREEEEYKVAFDKFKAEQDGSNKPEVRLKLEFKSRWRKEKKEIYEGHETGVYELCGAITHLGHSVDDGHYLAWIKENQEEWTKYDDNCVFQQPAEKIQQLRGGQPNLQIGYVLLYRKVYAPRQ